MCHTSIAQRNSLIAFAIRNGNFLCGVIHVVTNALLRITTSHVRTSTVPTVLTNNSHATTNPATPTGKLYLRGMFCPSQADSWREESDSNQWRGGCSLRQAWTAPWRDPSANSTAITNSTNRLYPNENHVNRLKWTNSQPTPRRRAKRLLQQHQ